MSEQGNQFLLGMDGRHNVSGTERCEPVVGPGHTLMLVTRAQLNVRIESLLVSADVAEKFALVDLQIGRNSWHAGTGDVPLDAFAVRDKVLVQLAELRGLPAAEGAAPASEDIVRPLLDIGTALVSMDIRACVRNTSGIPARFAGAYVVRAAPVYASSLHGMQRVTTSPPSSCELCTTQLEQLAQGVDWCATCGSTYVERKLRPSAFSLTAPEERLARMRELVTKARGW